ncbi:tetratricopeptide repeat protein [Agaribacterium sp. ZY112]|uniref:tetratricopeptide repeat protein n=1 Tax=Agaribacterium sp. ZY112 TaxID=3233574 RepID=UPI003523FFB5
MLITNLIQLLYPVLIRIVLIAVIALTVCSSAYALSKKAEKKREELYYGTVLFELYQRDFFNALINNAQVESAQNRYAVNEDGRLLKAGMQLSYGLPESARSIFKQTLDHSEDQVVRNAAWYYLAKLYYAKSNTPAAKEALSHIRGAIQKDLHIDYHYLSSLIGGAGDHLDSSREALDRLKDELPEYPYYLFNFAVTALDEGRVEDARSLMAEVQTYAYLGEEYEVLADRAKHGLSIVASQQGDLAEAWRQLSSVRTTGLYSNRALLSYAWTAIKLKQYKAAIPALQILDSRSIALPEVQESKVLLAHLYEQDQLPRKALKQNIVAEKEFASGLLMLDEAERIINMKDVPKEFIANLNNIVRETDWYGERPEVDYRKLTPFLIDLLAANNFNEVLRELGDLYSVQENLEYWSLQEEQHLLILEESKKKDFDAKTREHINDRDKLAKQLARLEKEQRLLLLSLEQDEQDRFEALLGATRTELEKVNERIRLVKEIEEPYRPPSHLAPEIKIKQQQIREKLAVTNELVERLEVIVRAQVKHELSRHRSRMTYYQAQARLAKARLYDATLQDLNKAKKRVKQQASEVGKQ